MMKTKIYKGTSDVEVELAAAVLKAGGLVVFPTETVYGLGALISWPEALKKIYEIKGRDEKKPLSILLADAGQLDKVIDFAVYGSVGTGLPATLGESGQAVGDCSFCSHHGKTADKNWLQDELKSRVYEAAETERLGISVPLNQNRSDQMIRRLADTFWPGPLTLVLPKKESMPDEVTSGLPSVGVRIPDHPFALALLKAVGEPVATTSANLSGGKAAASAQEAADVLDGKVNLIIDGGECPVKVASTVAAISPAGDVTILREGVITREELLNTMQMVPGI